MERLVHIELGGIHWLGVGRRLSRSNARAGERFIGFGDGRVGERSQSQRGFGDIFGWETVESERGQSRREVSCWEMVKSVDWLGNTNYLGGGRVGERSEWERDLSLIHI